MSFQNVSFCRYRTDNPDTWTREQWRVWNIVQAIKGYECKGYAFLQVSGSLRRLDSNNKQVAIDWFVERFASSVQLTGDNNYLCPIPDSCSTPTSTHVSRPALLAQALTQRVPTLSLWLGLRFKQPMQKRIRDEDILYDNLMCLGSPPKGYLILLDDVCTKGAHARAARRRLIEEGANGDEMSSMSVARTMLSPDEGVFGVRVDDL